VVTALGDAAAVLLARDAEWEAPADPESLLDVESSLEPEPE
jgi:hypothetical protein